MIVVVAVLVATGVFSFPKDTEEQTTATGNTSAASTTQNDVTTTQTETTTAKTENHSAKESIDSSSFTDEYVGVIEQYQKAVNNPDEEPFTDPIYKKYSVYDIDKDGAPSF